MEKTLKSLYKGMDDDSRKSYLESLRVGVENWTSTLFDIFQDRIMFNVLKGKGVETGEMKNALSELRTAIQFVSGNASRLSEWKKLMGIK
jgi:hypothetical protein